MHQSLVSIIALVCVIPLIFLTLWLFKKSMVLRLSDNQDIKIINQMSLGSRERLLLLKVKQETILIGVTAQQITTLHVCNDSSTMT
ncbi:flagellar biosynthetic protein FliO [Legionella sp. CNM-4043-24]|uniref:flagellar biosynthetic protein FliO n=1 Tax=Legionella sp. CNM-4043-24 TaxID=3421646 RepID=UPI00403B0BBC